MDHKPKSCYLENMKSQTTQHGEIADLSSGQNNQNEEINSNGGVDWPTLTEG